MNLISSYLGLIEKNQHIYIEIPSTF